MRQSKPWPLETKLTLILAGFISLLLISGAVILALLDASILAVVTFVAFVAPILLLISHYIHHIFTQPFQQLLVVLDAIRNQDYTQQITPYAATGLVAQVVTEMQQLSTRLRLDNRRVDKNRLLIYQLVEVLDSPVLLVNAKGQLIAGNPALSLWLNRDWHHLRLSPISQLGFTYQDKTWQLTNSSTKAKLLTSQFSEDKQEYQLLVIHDISQQLNQVQYQAWQQQIRILSHEIRNSLTPIQSLAQTLASIASDSEQKAMLAVIASRSESLNTLVSQYSQLTNLADPAPQRCSVAPLLTNVTALYPQYLIETKVELEQVYCDPVLLEQVLINLITNAVQACDESPKIDIHVYRLADKAMITVSDNGRGLTNEADLFVPFYSTKPDGQGIGLSLCQQIIHQHQGEISLTNRAEHHGAIATISLPLLELVGR